jgi:hypothetical protein
MRYAKYLVVMAVLAISMGGCAFGTDYVHVTPQRGTSSSEKPGKGIEVYMTRVEDARSEPERVGQKQSGYVALEQGIDLTKVVSDSVANCLDSYGYTVKYVDDINKINVPEGQSVKVLNTSIDEFWTTFVAGFWTVDANAKVRMSFEVDEKGTDRVLWKKKIGKGATCSSGFGATPGLFEESLNNALAEEMNGLGEAVSSQEFIKAVSEPARSAQK